MSTFYCPYRMTLTDPLIITELAGDPNSAATRQFIPGSAVRGVVARELAASSEFDEYILSGSVRYLNAYPEIREQRSLPAPLSWVTPKYPQTRDQHYDLALWEEDWPDEQLERAALPFTNWSAPDKLGARPRVELAMHHVRDRKAGGPGTGEVGTLFQYEAIEEDQAFRGIIAVDADSEDAAKDKVTRLKALSLCSLGRSAETEYGGHPVVEWLPVEARELPVTSNLPETVAKGGRLLCVLTSAYAGTHPGTGQSDPAAIVAELETALKVSVTGRFWGFCVEGGFNAKWGLPLPQERCLQAGSVLVLEAREALTGRELMAVEASGLGRRRAEGFGRVVFVNPAGLSSMFQFKEPDREDQGAGGAPGIAGNPVLEDLQRRLLRSALEEQLRFRAAKHAAGVPRLPSSSLISGFRQALRDATLDEFASRVVHFRKKIQDYTVDGKSLEKWAVVPQDELKEWVEGLGLSGVIQSHSLEATTDTSSLTPDDLDFLRRAYLDEALALMARKARGNRD